MSEGPTEGLPENASDAGAMQAGRCHCKGPSGAALRPGDCGCGFGRGGCDCTFQCSAGIIGTLVLFGMVAVFVASRILERMRSNGGSSAE